jgi:hypothetical protein
MRHCLLNDEARNGIAVLLKRWRPICITFGLLIADGEAYRSAWSVKGAQGNKTCSLKCANLFNDAGLVRKSRYAMDIDCADVTKYKPRAFMRAPMCTSDAKLTPGCERERCITTQPLNGTKHKRCRGATAKHN